MRGGLLSLLMLYACALAAPAVAESQWQYTVRPGDDLWSIASRCCGSPRLAARIAEYNGLADGDRLRAGSRLRIPLDWLVKHPATASVIAVRGTARYGNGAPVAVGDRIEMGRRVRTEEGFVLVGFADGSELEIGPEAEVLFNVLTAFEDAGMVDTSLRFYKGRASSRIRKQRQGSSYRISTPSGVAAVRGTRFDVAAGAEQTLMETREGLVQFGSEGQPALNVEAGFGVVASAAGVVREALLPPPVYEHAAGTLFGGQSLVRWQPVAGAAAYRIVLYAAATGGVPVLSRRLDAPVLAVTELAGLPRGSYRFQVRGIAASGLEGLEAAVEYRLGEPAPAALQAQAAPGGGILRWTAASSGPYEIELSHARAGMRKLRTASTSLTLTDLPPGTWEWQVRSEGSPLSERGTLSVPPPAVPRLNLSVEDRRLSVDWPLAQDTEYQLQIDRDPAFRSPLYNERVAGPVSLPRALTPGTYHVRLMPIANDVPGAYTEARVTVEGDKPWWLLGLFLLPLL